MEGLRCLNCGVMITTNRRHSPANADTVRQTITQWIAPRTMTASDHVCDSCWTLASNVNAQHRHICVSCGRSLLRIRFHVLNMDSEHAYDIYRLVNENTQRRLGRQARIAHDNICHPCWQRADRLRNRQLSVASTSTSQSTSISITLDNTETESTPAVDETPAVNVIPAVDETAAVDESQNMGQVQLPSYLRAPDTQRHCVFQGCINTQRRVIPTSIRKRVLCDYNYYIPANCRVCNEHMSAALWHNLSEAENAINSFKPNHLEEIIAWFQSSQTSVVDFQNIDGINDDHLHYWIGLSRDQFNLILAEVPRINDMIRGQIALLAYLIKMRTGDSDERLSQLFNIPRRTLEVMMSKVRELLKQDFVPRHLGLSHISRQEVANRNLIIPNGLFGTADYSMAIAIFDGTYVYIQKSSNYKYQKQTYSLHKYRNLIKPFLLVCTDGYIIDVLGPYPATTSDADIMRNEFADGQPLKNYFASGDTFILDRGFRDAVPLLGQCHFNVSMPASLESGQHQLTTLQANKSRATTICRWVVEIVNGRFKRDYKLFRQDFFNVASKHVMTDFTIAAAIINSFHPLLTDRANAQTILNIIQNKMYTDNALATYVTSHDLNRRRAQFERINVNNHNVNDFPRLEFEQLILISLGPYQIKQARSYYGEHIRSGGQYEIEIYRESNSNLRDLISQNENKWLLRGRIQSRHVSRRVYFVYIVINNNLSGRDAIEQYCCNCLVGRRTVGCCAHVMSIIWYLSWARHEPNICPPAQFLDDLLIIYENE